jgi:chromosome segregation ATPase
LRALFTIFCLAVLAAMAFIFYAKYAKGPSGERARESLESSKTTLKAQGQVWQQRLAEFEKEARSISNEVMEGDHATSGVRQHLEALRERIEKTRKEMGPAYEDKLRKWKTATDESLEELKKESSAAKAKLDALRQDVSKSLSQSREKGKEEPGK